MEFSSFYHICPECSFIAKCYWIVNCQHQLIVGFIFRQNLFPRHTYMRMRMRVCMCVCSYICVCDTYYVCHIFQFKCSTKQMDWCVCCWITQSAPLYLFIYIYEILEIFSHRFPFSNHLNLYGMIETITASVCVCSNDISNQYIYSYLQQRLSHPHPSTNLSNLFRLIHLSYTYTHAYIFSIGVFFHHIYLYTYGYIMCIRQTNSKCSYHIHSSRFILISKQFLLLFSFFFFFSFFVQMYIFRFCSPFNLFCSTQFDFLHFILFLASNIRHGRVVLFSYHRKLTFR